MQPVAFGRAIEDLPSGKPTGEAQAALLDLLNRPGDAILRLRAQRRLTRTDAAYAVYHLSTPDQQLLVASLVNAIAVAVGAARTPGGLRIAA